MSQHDPPVASEDDGWWMALADASTRTGSVPAAASGASTALTKQDVQFAQQLGDALRRQSQVEQQVAMLTADPVDDARRRAALLERARQAGLLAPRSDTPRGETASPRPQSGRPDQDDKAPNATVAQAQPRSPASIPAPGRTPSATGARMLLVLGALTSVVLAAAMWWTGRPAGPPGPPPEVLRGSAVLETRFERQDAGQAARQVQAVLEAAGLAVEASRRPDERGFAWVLEFDAPAVPTVAAASGPVSALAALGLPAWQPGTQRWVFRAPAPLQREGAASKATNPAQ